MRFKLFVLLIALALVPVSTRAAFQCNPADPTEVGPSPCSSITEQGACALNPECSWGDANMPTPTSSGSNIAVPSGSNTGGTKEIIELDNPLSTTSIPEIVGNAVQVAMGILGSLALVVFVYGGFRWLTAAGNSESIEAGTGAMVWATIGIFIIFSSYAILELVFRAIGAQNNGSTGNVTGGAGGTYCLVSCVSENSCEEINQEAGADFESLDKKCSQPNYSIVKKACAEVAACQK